MKIDLLIGKIIPAILILAWLGSCGVSITASQYDFSSRAFYTCAIFYLILLLYIPLKTIALKKSDHNNQNNQKGKPVRKGLNLIAFFVIMILIGFLALITMPGMMTYKLRQGQKEMALEALDKAIMGQKVYFGMHKRYAGSIKDLAKYLDHDTNDNISEIQLQIEMAEKDRFVLVSHHKEHYEWYRYTWSDGKGIYEKYQKNSKLEPFSR